MAPMIRYLSRPLAVVAKPAGGHLPIRLLADAASPRVEDMVGIRKSDELHLGACRPGPVGEPVGAVDRHQMVRLANEDQRWRCAGGDVRVGGDAGVSVRKLLR